MNESGKRPGSYGPALALALAALVLYLPGIVWGLPSATDAQRIWPWGSDELAPIGALAQVFHVVLRGDSAFDPRYPLLPYLIQAAFMAPYLGWLRLTGGLQHFSSVYPYGLTDPVSSLAALTMVARLSSLLMLALVPAIAYLTVLRLADRRTAMVAGLFAMLLYPMFYYSRTSNADAGTILWTTLALFVVAGILRDGLRGRSAAWLGVFAALAISTKDQNYAIFVAVGLVIVAMHVHASRAAGRLRSAWVAPAIGLATSIAVYLVATGIIFRPDAFVRHVRFITEHPTGPGGSGESYYSTPATLAGYASLTLSYAGHLIDSMGLPMALAALAGLGIAARRQPRILVLALPALAVLIGVIMVVRFARIRLAFPAAYTLALFAAIGVAAIAGWNARPSAAPPGRARRGLAVIAIVAIAGWSAVRDIDLTWQMLHDSRYALSDWFFANASAGDRIGFYGLPLKLPALPADVHIESGPWTVRPSEPAPTEPGLPDFIVIIPQQPFEAVHEWVLPDDRFRALDDGEAGYTLVLATRGPALFDDRPMNWVNPPVRLYARNDRFAELRPPPSE